MSAESLPQISIVAPLYNEEQSFSFLKERLIAVLNATKLKVEVVLVNDGSKDRTPLLMNELSLSDERFTSVFLSRNYGHQIAVSAGMKIARGTEAVFIIDGDLQDPPELLETFYNKLNEGFDVVYGVRVDRPGESFFKLTTAKAFYRFLISEKSFQTILPSFYIDRLKFYYQVFSEKLINNTNLLPFIPVYSILELVLFISPLFN